MGFVKVVKNKAYYKRYQVKFRRRREGKTDYRARRKLIIQAKNKYNTPKYRLVVRFTNKDIICQIVVAKIKGDEILSAAYAHELPRYGLRHGLTNFSAAYATGLLIARRHLAKLGLARIYKGKQQITGADWHYSTKNLPDGPKPFKCLLDVGLVRTSTGSRVFGALKGACDGGLNIPHSETRFVGYDIENEKLDSDVLKKYIFGGHVADYMRLLQDKDPDKFKKQFSKYIAASISPDDLQGIYEKTHAAIRAKPSHKKKRKAKKPADYKPKRFGKVKKSLAERKARIKQKKEAHLAKAQE